MPDFEGLCSADMYPLKTDRSRLNREYLYWTLLSRVFTEYAISGSARTGMPKVNQEWLFSFRFPLPQLDAQLEACKILNSIRSETKKLGQIYDDKILLIKDKRNSLLASAFAGDL
jgi:type I restriction enzyme S subunit